MKIGLTFDLREDYLKNGLSIEEAAEFDSEETIAAIEQSLQKQGFITARIGNFFQLIEILNKGHRFDLIFNIAEGRFGVARESHVPALLEAYQIPYVFSDPLTLGICLDKSIAKHILRDQGIPTAPFCVINSVEECRQLPADLVFPVFAKPLAEGSSKGISKNSVAHSETALKEICTYLLTTFQQPVLIEQFLPGRELTVGIIGTGADAEVLGVLEINIDSPAESHSDTQKIYCHSSKMGELIKYFSCHLVTDPEAQKAATTALAAWRALRCRDGGRVDFRSDEYNIPQFLEVNPLAGLKPGFSDFPVIAGLVGMSYDEFLKRIVNSALKRAHKFNRSQSWASA